VAMEVVIMVQSGQLVHVSQVLDILIILEL